MMAFRHNEGIMKVRTQIQLDPRDHERIKTFARHHRLSMSAAVRMLILRGLNDNPEDDEARWEAFLKVGGSGRDKGGATDIARRHDDYLYGEA